MILQDRMNIKHQGHSPHKPAPHLLQNLSSVSTGLSQLLQNLEYDSFSVVVLWGSGFLDSDRRTAIFQTKTTIIIKPPATTAKRDQL